MFKDFDQDFHIKKSRERKPFCVIACFRNAPFYSIMKLLYRK